MKDLNIILISKDGDYFKEFSTALNDDQSLKVRCITSAEEALKKSAAQAVDVVVAAENLEEGSGLDLIKQVVKTNPFINTALVSPLPHEEFHEATEGLGIFMQLSPTPGRGDAEKFCAHLARIY